jgi:outer membrane biosynthesis protein TonB
MGRWKAWALAWLLAATLSALLLQALSARGDELLINGGFETELGGQWRTTSEDDVFQRACRPEAVVHSGECAGRLTCHGPQKCEVQQLIGNVGYGQEYELRAYIAQSHEGATTSVYVDWYESSDGTGTRIDEQPRQSVFCTEADDEPYDCLTTGLQSAPPEARSAKVKVLAADPSEGFTVYLDDFSFSGPPAPTPTPTPSPTPLPTASPPPSPGPTASPSPSPTVAPTATQVPTPTPSTPSPSPTATSQAATLLPVAGLVNGGFEEADGEGRPLAWQKYGGELSRSGAARREGQYAAAFTSRTASTKWAFQTVAVEGGEAYVLSGYALKNDANVAAAYLRLSWYASPDGSGSLIDSVDSTTRLTDDSPGFRFLSTGAVVAPAEAASAKVRLVLDPLSEAEGTVYFDDISFGGTTMVTQPEETPQPSPSPASSESPKASPVVPAAPVEELETFSPPDALPLPPSPTVLGATPSSPEATAFSRDGSPQTEEGAKTSPARTPVVLYRERRPGQSTQGGEGVAAGSDEGSGLSPLALVLAVVLATATAAGTAFFGWRRWKKRARPP